MWCIKPRGISSDMQVIATIFCSMQIVTFSDCRDDKVVIYWSCFPLFSDCPLGGKLTSTITISTL